jgi:pyruvate decarboxylase
MLDFFGDKDGAARTHQVHTKEELEDVLARPELENPKGVHVSSISPFTVLPFILYFPD